MPLYHRQVHGLPVVQLPRLTDLKLSDHAIARAAERGVPLSVLGAFDPTTYPVFQVETLPTADGRERIVKLNYRKRLNAVLDYCACVGLVERVVISCWVQYRTFQPFIDRSVYSKPRQGNALATG